MNEWVEVKGTSVDVAVSAGLAELGIENREHAEIEVLQEPEKGFLGIGRQDAIVRVKPRPKPKRKRQRNRRGDGDRAANRGRQQQSRQGGSRRQGAKSGDGGNRRSKPAEDRSGGREGSGQRRGGNRNGGRKAPREDQPRRQKAENGRSRPAQESTEAEAVDINEQAAVIQQFLAGLLEAFGLDGTVDVRVEEDIIYADINGEQTEALIGPKASILQAVHELTKTIVQRRTMSGARLRLDIGGYSERRREALTIYAGRLAEQVIDEDAEIMLEPMNPADRKVVHDAVSEIEGVRSFSEGEDPRRSVVLAPDQ